MATTMIIRMLPESDAFTGLTQVSAIMIRFSPTCSGTLTTHFSLAGAFTGDIPPSISAGITDISGVIIIGIVHGMVITMASGQVTTMASGQVTIPDSGTPIIMGTASDTAVTGAGEVIHTIIITITALIKPQLIITAPAEQQVVL